MIGNDAVGDRIYSRIRTTRTGSMARGNLVNFIKGFLLSALALVLGLPHQSTLAADAVIKGLLSSAFDMKKRLGSSGR